MTDEGSKRSKGGRPTHRKGDPLTKSRTFRISDSLDAELSEEATELGRSVSAVIEDHLLQFSQFSKELERLGGNVKFRDLRIQYTMDGHGVIEMANAIIQTNIEEALKRYGYISVTVGGNTLWAPPNVDVTELNNTIELANSITHTNKNFIDILSERVAEAIIQRLPPQPGGNNEG
ncbi:hypothetical protein [Ancylobacter sp. FA202]|uniref:hypothetical protein n=1 Tax=Ancylobacter sp. FA202 TaxID=1111106 RepID=UPI0018DED24A|nr:hypothetical protein [Ancylobacter sp. FA202]